MKRLSGIILAMCMLGSVSTYAQNNQEVLNKYLALKNDLVEANSANATNNIVALKKAIPGSDVEKNTALIKAIDKMAMANNIDKQRKEFEEVSTLLWKVIKEDKSIGQTVYYQYCPMKKAYWISKEEGIKNPYYGQQMLTCGKVVEKTNKK